MNSQGQQGWSVVARATAWATFGLFVVLGVGAIYFYQERMLFCDAPHILFRVINDQAVQITERRIGVYITQVLPLLGTWLHLPLKAVLLLYSASFVLVYCLAGWLLWRLRQHALLVLMGLYLTLFCSAAYYWTNNEIHQGIPLLFTAFGCTNALAARKAPLLLVAPVLVLLGYIAIWTHPLVLIIAIYLWLFQLVMGPLNDKSLLYKLVLTLIVVLLCYLKYLQSSRHGYDNAKLEGVAKFGLDNVKDILGTAQLRLFLTNCLKIYWAATVVLVATTIWLLRRRKVLPLLLVYGYSVVFLALVCLTFPSVSNSLVYIESEYMILGIIWGAPFVYYVLPTLSARVAWAVLVPLYGIRLCYILMAGPVFTERVQHTKEVLATMRLQHLKKAIVLPTSQLDSLYLFTWGLPTESITLSALEGDRPQLTFIIADTLNGNHLVLPNGADTFAGCFEKRPVARLNIDYYSIDTTTPYQVLPTKK
jgi:hypothetical protein